MKVRLIHFLLLFISCNFSAQEKYCKCEKFESLVDCKKHIFSNAASIHWEYNCEKGKIIFENKKVKKKLFEIETDFMDRIGYQFANEYENKFLFTYKWISGCCEPFGYYLHDKNTGNLVQKIEKGIAFSENNKIPYLVYLSSDYNKLILLNIDTFKTIQFTLPKNKIVNTIKNSDEPIAEFLFEDNQFEIHYFKTTLKYFENNKWLKKKIMIKLN